MIGALIFFFLRAAEDADREETTAEAAAAHERSRGRRSLRLSAAR